MKRTRERVLKNKSQGTMNSKEWLENGANAQKMTGKSILPYGLARTVMPRWIPCPSFFSMEGAPLQTQPSYKRMTTDHLAVPSPVRHMAFRETTRRQAYCKYYNNFISMHVAGNRSPILSLSVVISKSLLMSLLKFCLISKQVCL